MLELRNIKKQYNSNLILDIPFFKLESGIYWIKGANGSGKTTLLKMISGLMPFEGDILFNGISLKSKSMLYRQQVSWSEAEPLFPSFLSGKELVKLYQKIRSCSQQDIDDLVELFEMTEYLNNAIGTYSAGMTKKLSLLLAFPGNAPLIVLDEPLITLDAAALKVVYHLISEKHKTYGTCFVMSSHQKLEIELPVYGKQLTVQNKTIAAG